MLQPTPQRPLLCRNCSRGEPYQSLDCLFEPLSTCGGSFVTEENSFAIPVGCRRRFAQAGPMRSRRDVHQGNVHHRVQTDEIKVRVRVIVRAETSVAVGSGLTVELVCHRHLACKVGDFHALTLAPTTLCGRAQAFDTQELNASHSPLPWTYRRGPEYWEERLREHYIARGVNVTSTYLKYWWRAQARRPCAQIMTRC